MNVEEMFKGYENLLLELQGEAKKEAEYTPLLWEVFLLTSLPFFASASIKIARNTFPKKDFEKLLMEVVREMKKP